MELKPIAHIENDYTDKFGIPRQAGLADVPGRIVFEPEYRRGEAFRGLDGFDYIWLIWGFSEPFARADEVDPRMGRPEDADDAKQAAKLDWSPTVRPPRLGGNRRMGVFATRSPNRPNPIGLSSVRLERVETDPVLGPVLYVRGADLLNGSPIYDIKPYVPMADCHEGVRAGFADEHTDYELAVDFPAALLGEIPEEKRNGLCEALAQDPRPTYKDEADRVYGLSFGGFNLRFTVKERTLTVISVERLADTER